MKRVKQLLQDWSEHPSAGLADKKISVLLKQHDYARLCALADLYADRRQDQILADLISAILDEVEEALPYIPGQKIVAEDEFGDPVYEDLGLTRRFEQLVKKYSKPVNPSE